MILQHNLPPQESVTVFRIENPTVPAQPNGVTSHEELVGQWFSPNLDTATRYLRKTTRTSGPGAVPIMGSQLVIAQVPKDQLDDYHVSRHPIASTMDVENDNYIVPRDGSIPTVELPLDDVLDGLHGKLGNVRTLIEAKQRVAVHVGNILLDGSDPQK